MNPFKRTYVVKWLRCYGAMSVWEDEYICKAYCKYHAYRQFRKDTINADHYADRTVLDNFYNYRCEISLKRKNKNVKIENVL